MAEYLPYTLSNYPTLPQQMNYTGDILLRLNYLSLVSKAYWQTPTSKDMRNRLEKFLGQDTQLDLLFFNNSEINPSIQSLFREDLSVSVTNDKTPEASFRDLILQIDALKREMEVYMLDVIGKIREWNFVFFAIFHRDLLIENRDKICYSKSFMV